MALVKPILGPFGVIASYFRIVGWVVSASDQAAIIKVGAYTNRASREENAEPIPLFQIEHVMHKAEGFRDGITVAEMYEFLKTKDEFKDAVFEGSTKPEKEKFPYQEQPAGPGASQAYLDDHAKADGKDAGLQVSISHPKKRKR